MGSCRHPVTSDLVSVETVPSSDNVFYLKKKIKPGKLQTCEVLQHVQGKNIWKALFALKIGLSENCHKGGLRLVVENGLNCVFFIANRNISLKCSRLFYSFLSLTKDKSTRKRLFISYSCFVII